MYRQSAEQAGASTSSGWHAGQYAEQMRQQQLLMQQMAAMQQQNMQQQVGFHKIFVGVDMSPELVHFAICVRAD